MKRWGRRVALLFLTAAAAFVAVVLPLTNLLLLESAKGRTYSDINAIPHRPVGLVLGCSKYLANGQLNAYYANRIAAAVALYRSGKVDDLLVSGQTAAHGYNEPADMRASLIEAGVPAAKIHCDYQGARTLDSMIRAKAVFGQTKLIVVSQEFHNRRAIFIAEHRGIDALGFNAPDVAKDFGFLTRCREELADVRAVLDVFVLGTIVRSEAPALQEGVN